MASQSNKAGPSRSPSSGNSHGRFEYDVFLSFRGEDTRNNFAGLLHDRLYLHAIRAFFDEEDLHKGDRIDGILEAISRSQLYVPIFSQRYAESKWCLREVAKMVECCHDGGQERRIIPVFFDVDPKDVRYQSGPFEAAFQKHEKKNRDEVDGWKHALGHVGGISGFHLKNGNQRELIQSITAEIQKILPTEMLLDEGEYTVGHEYRVEEMMKRLEFKAKDVRIIGIHGIGGIGKTTLAKAVYNRSHRFFGASSFIENVREESESKGLVQVQKQLIQDLSKDKYEKRLNNISQGTQMIKRMVGIKSVLLVLDDVDGEDQLKKLACDISLFHSGSRIIITTRHEAILKSAGLQDEAIYRLEELDEKESLLLFQYHAFKGDETTEEYLKLSEEIVSISNGLPLVLEAFGSHFKTAESPQEWNKLLEELRGRQYSDVHEKLRICYDRLKDNEKLIFLDIACLLVRKNKEDAIYMWEGHNLSPNQAIRSLQNKSLIKIKKGKFEMHDQIREMGREIVRMESLLDPENCSRLWREVDIVKALKPTKSREVQGIILREGSEMKSSTEAFKIMSELRILLLNFAIFDEFEFRHFPASLKWLEWKNCPLETLPLDVKFKSIVVLNLSGSCISQLWSETTTGTGSSSISSKTTFDGLKVLDLSCCHCLYATPNFGMTPNLKRLIFVECSRLKEVDDSIESLKELVSLSMRGCVSLERLPKKIYELSSLEVFNLEGCSSLANFPQFSPTNSTNGLSKLGELTLRDCESLESLPDLDKFKSLRILHIDGCQSLDHIRKNLFEDKKCEYDELIVSGSKAELSKWKQVFSFILPIGYVNDPLLLQQLECYGYGDPSKNGTMKLCVGHQYMTNGRVLKNIETIHEAHFDDSVYKDKLCGYCYTVNFGRKDKINEASRSKIIIMKLTSSSSFYLTEVVAKLQKASKFSGECMKPYISISWKQESPDSLNSKPDFSMFFHQSEEDKLDVNVIKYSNGLDERIGRIANMISCRERSLHFGWTIEELIILTLLFGSINVTWYKQCSGTPLPPKVFVKMKVLDLSYCKFLAKTHDLAQTPHLEKLILDHCECLVEIGESIGQLKNLILLSIVGCAKLDSLPCSTGSLENLQELILDDCTSLTRIPDDIGELKGLRRLSLKYCRSLERLPNSIGSFENLHELILDGCALLTRIPYCVGELKGLCRLSLKNCRSLHQLPNSIGSLENLQELILDDCISLTRIPDDVGELKGLRRLSLKDCHWLEQLSNSIGSLENLQELILDDCSSLKRIPDVRGLKSLCRLSLKNCRSLQQLPNSIGRLENLQELILDDCTSLSRIPDDVGELKSLHRLSLKNWHSLYQLPNSIVSLENLLELILDGCTSLTRIPDDVGELKGLRRLSLKDCHSLEQLSNSIGNLAALEELNVARCRRLSRIHGLQNLRSLKVLHMDGCWNLDLASIGLELEKAAFHDLEAFSISSRCCKDYFKKISLPFPIGGCAPLLVQNINVNGKFKYGGVDLEIKVARGSLHSEDNYDFSVNFWEDYEINKRRRLLVPGYSLLKVDAFSVNGYNFTASFQKDDEINKCLRVLVASSDDDATRVGTLYIYCSPLFWLRRADIWFHQSPPPAPAD